MRMVVRFIRSGFHWPIASHHRLAGADERIAIWARHVLEKILREQPAVEFDVQPIGQLSDLDPLARGSSRTLLGRKRGVTRSQEERSNRKIQNPQHGEAKFERADDRGQSKLWGVEPARCSQIS